MRPAARRVSVATASSMSWRVPTAAPKDLEEIKLLRLGLAFSSERDGAPISMPSAFASFDRAVTQPSLLLRITIALPCNSGWNMRSQEA